MNSTKSMNLVEEKEIDYGPVKWSDVRDFLSFSAGTSGFILYLLISVIVSLLQLGCSYVLAYWAKLPFEEQQRGKYPWFLFGVTVAFFVFSILRALIGVCIINKSA